VGDVGKLINQVEKGGLFSFSVVYGADLGSIFSLNGHCGAMILAILIDSSD
jgi:hypothetical protein